MLPPAVAVQPEPTVLDPPPPPANAGAGRGAVPPAEPGGLLEGEEAVAGAVDGGGGGDVGDEDESEAGVLGVPKPPPLLPPRAVAI